AARSISPGLPNSCPKTDIDGSLSFLYCCIYLSMESYQRTTAKREKKKRPTAQSEGPSSLLRGQRYALSEKQQNFTATFFQKNALLANHTLLI
ncbi:MAG: hypothetical protein IKN86_07790, partial [Bacteroidaceae bacterium]|nr:hypothetical protein [Bacteroidaceae bacterium]